MAALFRVGLHLSSRRMATATATASNQNDPIQKLFLDKVKEFVATNKTLDESHSKFLESEMTRLKRVYRIDDERNLGKISTKFDEYLNVSLRDLDEKKELRAKIMSGEILEEEQDSEKVKSALLETIPDQTPKEFSLPPLNKPDIRPLLTHTPWAPSVPELGEDKPDWKSKAEEMTPYKLQRKIRVMFGDEMPTIDDDKSPQRDVVNFPRYPQLINTPPTRHHIIPESWFQFLYPKTGVSGPYMLFGGWMIFMLSKEWFVIEHEFFTGVCLVTMFSYLIPKYGPIIKKYLADQLNEHNAAWDEWQAGHINFFEQVKDRCKNELGKSGILNELYAIRKADIETQVENEYRQRVKSVFEDTKRRLDYLVSVADTQQTVARKNMVNWVISNSVKAIGPNQETQVLDSCIANLKQLASKSNKVI